MKLDRAEMTIGEGRMAIYFGAFVEADLPAPIPALLVQVEDFEEARAILDTLERSAARKKSTSPPAPAAAKPAPQAPAAGRAEGVCSIEGCTFDAEKDGVCRDHSEKLREVAYPMPGTRAAAPVCMPTAGTIRGR